MRGEIERLTADLQARDQRLADALVEYQSARATLVSEHAEVGARREAEHQARQAEWDERQRDQATEADRRLAAELELHETERRDLTDRHDAELRRSEDQHGELAQQLEQRVAELAAIQEQLGALEHARDDGARQRDAVADERDRLKADRDEIGQNLDAMQRALDQQAAAHRDDLAQLANEFDSLRSERDALRDRQADPSLESLRTELQHRLDAEQARNEELSRQLDALRADLTADPRPSGDEAAAVNGDSESDRDTPRRLSELQSQLEVAEASRSMLIDALKVAQEKVESLSLDLREVRTENQRINSMLNAMGIHLL
jgi:chromosome segregation ATPase